MNTTRRIVSLVLVVAATTSCFLKKKQTNEETTVWEPVTVAVTNHNWQEIVVYAIVGSSRQRLGTVPAVKQATFQLPTGLMAFPGTVNLLLDPIGSRSTFRTGAIAVGSGQQIRLTVENQLTLSNWTVQ
jgi:hypothetical protein